MHGNWQHRQGGWNRPISSFGSPQSQRETDLSFESNTSYGKNSSGETTNTSINSDDYSGDDYENKTSVEYQQIYQKPGKSYCKPKCSISQEDKKSQTLGSNGFYFAIYALIGIIFVIVVAKISTENETSKKNCSYDDLKEMFPKESQRMWFDLSVGIGNILDHRVNKPGVYLFLHKNKEYTHNLVEKIAKKSSYCYDKKMLPVELKEEFFRADDYGHIIESFKEKIEQSRVFIISNLNEIPALSARALHYICDTFSPIEKNVIIYLTLVPTFSSENPSSNARKTLTTLWGSKLQQYELDSLITRVTDAVIQLQG